MFNDNRPLTPQDTLLTEHNVTAYARSLDVEQAEPIDLDGTIVALVRTENGIFAVSNTCTHADANLSDGFVMENWIECPLHQARYDLSTGELIDGPFCESLATYKLEQRGDEYFVTL